MKKFLIFFVLSILITSFISAFSDQGLPQQCGGDSELVIGCLGDDQIIFLGGLPTTGPGGLGVDIGPESVNISPKIPIVVQKEEEAKKPLLLYIIPLFLFFCFLIFIYKRRKDKKEEEERKKKTRPQGL